VRVVPFFKTLGTELPVKLVKAKVGFTSDPEDRVSVELTAFDAH
jgi:hypothetical protein